MGPWVRLVNACWLKEAACCVRGYELMGSLTLEFWGERHELPFSLVPPAGGVPEEAFPGRLDIALLAAPG